MHLTLALSRKPVLPLLDMSKVGNLKQAKIVTAWNNSLPERTPRLHQTSNPPRLAG